MTASTPIDQALLDRLRTRDPETLSSVVNEHARPLYRAARGFGFAREESEDLAQDVFTTFLTRLDQFEGRSQLRTWLFGILHHKVMERRRAALKNDQIDSIDEVFEARFSREGGWIQPPQDLERLLLSKEIDQMLRKCLEGLPVNQREAFVLREMEGLGTPDICKILEIGVTHFGVLMHRARARLRECLEAKGWNQP